MLQQVMMDNKDANLIITNEFVVGGLEHRNKEIRNEALKCFKIMFNTVGSSKMYPWLKKVKKELILTPEMKKDCIKLYEYYKAIMKN